MCGITTGGREDCFWDCEIEMGFNGPIVSTPECLLDCFPEVRFLVNPLLYLYKDVPICLSSGPMYLSNTELNIKMPLPAPASFLNCRNLVSIHSWKISVKMEYVTTHLMTISIHMTGLSVPVSGTTSASVFPTSQKDCVQ